MLCTYQINHSSTTNKQTNKNHFEIFFRGIDFLYRFPLLTTVRVRMIFCFFFLLFVVFLFFSHWQGRRNFFSSFFFFFPTRKKTQKPPHLSSSSFLLLPSLSLSLSLSPLPSSQLFSLTHLIHKN